MTDKEITPEKVTEVIQRRKEVQKRYYEKHRQILLVKCRRKYWMNRKLKPRKYHEVVKRGDVTFKME